MAVLKIKEIRSMNEKDKQEKLKDLKIELLKARSGKIKVRAKEIKKAIARILTK